MPPNQVMHPINSLPAAIKAPSIIILDMALVTDIRGVCKAGVTFQTT